MLVVAVGISGGAQARLNRSECKATCNANAPDPAACYVKYECDSQPDGPVNKARVNDQIKTYNAKYRAKQPGNFGTYRNQ